MRSGILEVPVAPGVLKWARETMGKTLDDVAKRLDLGRATVEAWETGQKHPTLKQLRELSVFLKRPLAAFFLPGPPQEAPLPADFRTLPADSKKPFTEKTLLALRRARRLQSLSREIASNLGDRSSFAIETASLGDDVRSLADRTRQMLGVSVERQFEWKNEPEALSEWKKAAETRGVLVLELSFPIKEGRAFSLTDDTYPVIVLNSGDSLNARIFSLFHEFGHLLLGQGGICDLSEEGKAVEQFTNRFSGEFLVPEPALLVHPVAQSHIGEEWGDDDLSELGRQFKVSREVILRRLLITGSTTRSFYERKQAEWEASHREIRPKVRRRVPARQCLRQNGIAFTVRVLESAARDMITYRDVSDYLSIGLKHLPAVEALLSGDKTHSA
jgi:Zn-dependent peptidase ImmA (M78 family)/transcriptional regulator with XRE-family HTH domain